MVADNPKLKEDPPLLESTERPGANGDDENDNTSTDSPEAVEVTDASGPAKSESAPEVSVVRVHQQVSALSILCMLTALLSPLFFPALAAIPLGVFALRRINESDGMLSGRHLAITGLCIASTALALWMAFFAFIWLVGSVLG
jgi:hypothetical protein